MGGNDAGGSQGEAQWPTAASSYSLIEDVGQGVSATVWRAKCIPLNKTCAVKVVDLEKCAASIDEVRREAQTMALMSHANVVSAYTSFTSGQNLWVVMPYLAGGSLLNVMKAAYPKGMPEDAIAIVLRDTLRGLEYLHKSGHIHRDVKAGNILLDDKGGVKLGDFGVSAGEFGFGRSQQHQTFVGTPCWMAPEVMEQVQGYDWHADIWSFGITALELAHGHAPFSRYPPMKVLLMTIQNPPPSLDSADDKGRFSQGFRDVVAMCLQKHPARRPSATELLKHKFFKSAKDNSYLQRMVIDKLPPLGERVQSQRRADVAKTKAAMEEEKRSSIEYRKGVSGWNFDLDQLKAEAAALDAAEAAEQQAAAAAPAAAPTAPGPRIASRGRFTIEEEDSSPSTQQASASAPAVTPESTGRPASRSTVVQKGRFHVESEETDTPDVGAQAQQQQQQQQQQKPQQAPSGRAVQRGRFTVEENADEPHPEDSGSGGQQQSAVCVNDVLPQLQMLLLQTANQQDSLRSLINTILPDRPEAPDPGSNGATQRELHQMVVDLQERLQTVVSENKDLRERNTNLERQLNHMRQLELEKEDNEDDEE
uniref:Protein kinase domain-containing protein n=2 Tax=Prasinoderma coloniale TaxID=156133 RepID=A0A7R9TTH5_9VIRI|eukprot:PRCOL_00004273-RA